MCAILNHRHQSPSISGLDLPSIAPNPIHFHPPSLIPPSFLRHSAFFSWKNPPSSLLWATHAESQGRDRRRTSLAYPSLSIWHFPCSLALPRADAAVALPPTPHPYFLFSPLRLSFPAIAAVFSDFWDKLLPTKKFWDILQNGTVCTLVHRCSLNPTDCGKKSKKKQEVCIVQYTSRPLCHTDMI